MRPRDWFGVGIRLLGVWYMGRGIADFLTGCTYLIGIAPKSLGDRYEDPHTAMMFNLWYAAGFLAFALYLIFGAEGLTKWIFDEFPRDDDDEPENDE